MRFTSEELGGGYRAEKQERDRNQGYIPQAKCVLHAEDQLSAPALPRSLKEWLPLGNSHEIEEPLHFSAKDLILIALASLLAGNSGYRSKERRPSPALLWGGG